MAETSNLPIIKPKYVKLDKKKRAFIEAWLDPKSETWGNAYQSAVAVGYSEAYARTITTEYRNIEWIQQAKDILKQFTPMHIIQGFQTEAINAVASRDRLKALEQLAKVNGMYVDRSEHKVQVQFTNAVPRPTRPVIDVIEATE